MPKKPRRKLTEKELHEIEAYSAIRLPMDQIASLLGMSETWLLYLSKKDEAVRCALLGGRSKASRTIRQTLYQMATVQKDFQALKFWCVTQEGFRTTEKLEISGPDGAPIETHEVDRAELLARARKLKEVNDLTDDE